MSTLAASPSKRSAAALHLGRVGVIGGCVLVLLACGDGEPSQPIAPNDEPAAPNADPNEPVPDDPSGPQAGDDAPAPPSTGPSEVAAFECDESASARPEGLRRLTMTQYRNTVRDLTRWVLGDATAADVVVTMAGLDGVPLDRRQATPQDPHGSYRRLDQAVDQMHVDETFSVAASLASALAAPERLATVVGACATDDDASNDEACITDFIARFGARALRRPLEPNDASFYRAVYGSDSTANSAAYADVITVMLSAPEFLYFVEHGEAEVAEQPGTYELSAHELASRLSYHFWQTLPDDALWEAAEDGSLLEPETLTQQVQRLLDDARARATMDELFGDFLKLEALPPLDAHAQDPVFAAFAGDHLPNEDLRQQMIDEALDMLAYYTWTAPGGVEVLFTSELSFARSEALAHIYGAEPWDGSSPPPALPEGEHDGLLTRGWFLASGSVNTRPIMRGVFVRRHLLCDGLAPPPANVTAILPARQVDQTTRQTVEALTEQPGTSCASCHASFINPLGFAFEGYDALGRVRSEEPLFEDDGTQVGALPVDTATVPRVTPSDERASRGPADLVDMMLESGKLEACLARNYFRFTFGRWEDLGRDGCALERLRTRLVESGRIRDMIEEVALLPALRQRTFEAAP